MRGPLEARSLTLLHVCMHAGWGEVWVAGKASLSIGGGVPQIAKGNISYSYSLSAS